MDNEKNVSSKPKSNKKKNAGLRFFLSVVIIVVLGYVVLNYVPFISKYDHYVIATGSMDPVIKIGDVVIIDTSTSLDELQEGDIIAFYADIFDNGTKEIVVHYLYSITDVDGVRIFNTKPEISDQIDPWDLVDEDIVGSLSFKIAKIGPLLMFAQSTIGRIVLVIDVVVIYLLIELVPKSEDKKKKSEDEEANPTEISEEE